MKTVQDVVSAFLENWTGPDLTYLKRGRYYFYEISGINFFIKFSEVPMAFTLLKVEVLVGFENIAIARIHSDCVQVKYHTLKFPVYCDDVGLWALGKKPAFLGVKTRNKKKNYGAYGWSFNSDSDDASNIEQMVNFTKLALEELEIQAISNDFIQEFRSISEDGNGFYQPPRFFLQLADLMLKKDKRRLKERLAIIGHHNQGVPALANAYYSKKLSDM
jgi:hypothetical protein